MPAQFYDPRLLNLYFIIALLFTLALNAILYATVAYGAPGGVGFIVAFAIFPIFPALYLVPISLYRLRTPADRPRAWRTFVVATLYICLFVLARHHGFQDRTTAFHALAKRSQPLVDAITQYTKDNGAPPPSLAALVPTYISSIPDTGMGAYPKYEYSIDPSYWHGNPWVLYVSTPNIGLNFDRFVYYPLQNYPLTGHSGSFEPMQNWAYHHE